ncbi:peptidase s8 s53 subtilisin kexin sedolisin [Lichtheimia corymbifera JMRC:FSU:9682]|uniref:Peptidase s8 s53 subtilisin kexin sedolisin n=1 Tax=Lichtheimia corymbifera JMRC:FSU:9682 TaxID=1263082 RepID=A0A068SAZ7_9FUNG|nr:peptidase s8 s53 subtilisin kexin sedolisin [Lichtheimia corymbifera JMRC:FSU:9682]
MKLSILTVFLVGCCMALACSHKKHPVERSSTQKYIVQVNHDVDVLDFIPNFLENAFQTLEDLIHETEEVAETVVEDVGKTIGKLFKRCHKKPEPKAIQVHDIFDIGGMFKAFQMELHNDTILDTLLDITQVMSIIPDDDIEFHLPKPNAHNSVDKRDESDDDDDDTSTATQPTPTDSSSSEWSSTTFSSPTATHTSTTKGHKNDTITYIKMPEKPEAPWNLVRISQRELDLEQPYTTDSLSGAGVTVYIIDDGLAIHNEDFEKRASYGWSAVANRTSTKNMTRKSTSSAGGGKNSDPRDGGGHGTHVAGIIGGKHYGVAKNVTLVGVQVLQPNGKGSVSNFLGGINWVVEQEKNQTRPVLINLSLGLPKENVRAKTLAQAVEAAVKAGIPVIAAAGNSAIDACDIVPANSKNVFTVGSTTQDDELDVQSCYGACVDVLAPGFDITSTYIGESDSTATMSGTSMSAPHVSGVAAMVLPYLDNPTPKELYKVLRNMATRNKISGIPDKKTPNALLYNKLKNH